MNVLRTKDLHKQYGRITAVNQLNLEIDSGSVFGLLGPNGSGKTTTLGMILDVTRPTSGNFTWFDKPPSHEQRKRIGAILEKPNFYPNISAYKNLTIASKIKQSPLSRIDEVLEQVGLLDRAHDPFRTYSLGMKQRLAIGSALLSHPEVLILDEPTNGLDPKGISEIRQLIIDIAQSGKTIMLASHLLDEVQKVCSEFAILKNGHLIYTGAVAESVNENIKIEVSANDLIALSKVLDLYPNFRKQRMLKSGIEVTCAPMTSPSHLNKFLVDHGIFVNQLQLITMNLEQKFMEILRNHD